MCTTTAHSHKDSPSLAHINTHSHLLAFWLAPEKVKWLNVLKALGKHGSSSDPWANIKCPASLQSGVYIQLHLWPSIYPSISPPSHPSHFNLGALVQTGHYTCFSLAGSIRLALALFFPHYQFTAQTDLAQLRSTSNFALKARMRSGRGGWGKLTVVVEGGLPAAVKQRFQVCTADNNKW